MRLYLVEIKIFEAATNYAFPVVVHQFYGRTRDEAWGYHRSHLSTDTFMRDCETKGQFGNVTCQAKITFDGWTDYSKR